MQKIYKANPWFVCLLFKRNYPFPCDPIHNVTNGRLKIINKLFYATQTNLGLATRFKCKPFMTGKSDTQMFVTMRAETTDLRVPDVFITDRRRKQR